MHNRRWMLIAAVIALVILSSCTSLERQNTVDAVSQATPEGVGWMITLTGVRSDEIYESDIDAWIEYNPDMLREFSFEKKGETRIYEAIPLSAIIAICDDADGSMPYTFDKELWDSGYDITLNSADGYAATFDTAEFDSEDIYIALSQDGEKTPPMIIGEIGGQFWIKELTTIELSLAPVVLEENGFEFILEIGDLRSVYTLAELQAHPHYIEDTGEYKNSHDIIFSHIWGGVKLVDLIGDTIALTADQTVTIVSTDGYEMDYSGQQLLDQADGTWILAFIEDGEYMPEDPGYMRLVKVGPKNPQITGHISAKMIKKVFIEDVSFKDFTLTLESVDGSEILDRQTIQSGVTTHKSVVGYYHSKSDTVIEYMGIPLYELFSHYPEYKSVTIEAADGFSITLAAEQLEGNTDVILAMYYGDGGELSEREQPLVIAWDQDALMIPEGIKAVRNVSRMIIE